MPNEQPARCPDCDEGGIALDSMTRREFFTASGAAMAAAGVAVAGISASNKVWAAPRTQPVKVSAPESLVKALHDSLSAAQKPDVLMPWTDPLRLKVGANWAIVKKTISDAYSPDQQEMIRGILKGVTSDEWYDKFLAQMKNDGGGLDQYHAALFSDPANGKYEWVLTGRHVTMRCGGDPADNMAFGGPIFYGHAPKDTEDPGHPGNVFWYQARRANEVFQMLDSTQRKDALIALAPAESAIQFRKSRAELPGIPVGSLHADQKEHVRKVMHDMLAPYRKKDVEEVLREVKENGGFDALHLSFYKQEDLGNDGVWDIWRLEGPAFVWHFRGAPHVHTWVHIAKKP